MWLTGCSFHLAGEICEREPAYHVELGECVECRDEGFARCAGHHACVPHAAEVRGGEYVAALDDSALTVVRIRSLVAP